MHWAYLLLCCYPQWHNIIATTAVALLIATTTAVCWHVQNIAHCNLPHCREVIVSVKGSGEACDTGKTRVQAATTTVLSQNSVKQEKAANEAPDILLIACKSLLLTNYSIYYLDMDWLSEFVNWYRIFSTVMLNYMLPQLINLVKLTKSAYLMKYYISLIFC